MTLSLIGCVGLLRGNPFGPSRRLVNMLCREVVDEYFSEALPSTADIPPRIARPPSLRRAPDGRSRRAPHASAETRLQSAAKVTPAA